mmetsp:Transcript_17874/g.30829  ORF Transcript_17874/g.30829 Transcript_17874/m.30829 type:complete len:163 (-) Transcript_17874:271-759(-)
MRPTVSTVMDKLYASLLDDGSDATPAFACLGRACKVLAVASYLASYNPPSTDLHYFGVTSRSTRKRARRSNPTQSDRPAGPAAFSLDRLYAIATAIAIPPLSLSFALDAAVGDLLAAGLIQSDHPKGTSAAPSKFRTCLTESEAVAMADLTGCPLSNFLFTV